MHQLDQSKPKKSYVADLVRESELQVTEEGYFERPVQPPEAFYGAVYENRGLSMSIDIQTKDGNRQGIYFHEISDPQYNLSDGIQFRTATKSVHIQGKNLEKIYKSILEHKLQWIKEKEGPLLVSNTKTPIITKITIETV